MCIEQEAIVLIRCYFRTVMVRLQMRISLSELVMYSRYDFGKQSVPPAFIYCPELPEK
jgi:hypothetical protein